MINSREYITRQYAIYIKYKDNENIAEEEATKLYTSKLLT